jgi:hypothetical protein
MPTRNMLKSWERYEEKASSNKTPLALAYELGVGHQPRINQPGYPSILALVFPLFFREVRPQPMTPTPAAMKIMGT